jgi:hypothetical protein
MSDDEPAYTEGRATTPRKNQLRGFRHSKYDVTNFLGGEMSVNSSVWLYLTTSRFVPGTLCRWPSVPDISGGGLQAELFHIPTHGHLFSGGSVHTPVGRGRDPLAQLRIHVREAMRLASLQPAKKVPPQVLHSGFDLAFGLRSIRRER